MKITVFAAGSRGDIQPCAALCQALVRAGHEPRLAAPESFSDLAREWSLVLHPLRGDVQKIMASDEGRAFIESGGSNPLKSIKAIRSLISPVIETMCSDALEACRGADALVCLGILGPFGLAVSEVLGIPVIFVEPTPLLPTQAFPAASWPLQHDLGGLHNQISGRVMFHVAWLWYSTFVKDFRARLGLRPLGAAEYFRTFRSSPIIGAYSPQLIPKPADWPDTITVAGYFFLDEPALWQPPRDLLTFLDAGPPPVCIGFGSMAGEDPERIASCALESLALSGQRGLILSGWGGMRTRTVPSTVFVLDAAPHSWLFPRMAAVVHHGGAGTTAEGLRAGRPSVILPFILDQAFWGARIRTMGLGPPPVLRKKLTAVTLARAIGIAVENQSIRARTEALGRAIRLEDGTGTAVRYIEDCLDNPAVGRGRRNR